MCTTHTTLTSLDCLVAVQAKDTNITDRTCIASKILGAWSLCGILDQIDPSWLCDVEYCVHVSRLSAKMNNDYRASAGGYTFFNTNRIHIERISVYIRKDRRTSKN